MANCRRVYGTAISTVRETHAPRTVPQVALLSRTRNRNHLSDHANEKRYSSIQEEEIMPLPPRLSSLWRNLFHKARKDQELAEEIDAYLEMLIEQKINEGLDPAEARRAALIELGGRGQVKEKVREVRLGHQLET